MNRVLEFLGWGLVGLGGSFRIALQVDVHLTHGADIAAFGVVGEFLAVDLVETIVSLSIDHDVHIFEIGVATFLELNCVGGANGENGPAALGLGESEAFAGLLNVEAQLLRNAVQLRFDPGSDDEVRHGNQGEKRHGKPYQPFAYLSDGLEHLRSSLPRRIGRRLMEAHSGVRELWS